MAEVIDKKAILARVESSAVNASEKTSRIKGCIYGPKGAGKSVLVVALAKKLIKPGQKIVFVDKSEGWLSLRNHKDWGLLDDVIIISYESTDQLMVVAEAIRYQAGIFQNVGALILDDADFMASAELNNIWDARVAAGTSTLDEDKPERPDYLKLQKQFIKVIDYVYDNTPEVHLLMTAHAAEKKNNTGTVMFTFPGFNPALADDIAGRQQIVAYIKAKEVSGQDKDSQAQYTRTLQVHPTAMIDAKTRVGFDKVRVPYLEFISTVIEWSKDGKQEDNEAEAIKKEIETKKIHTDDESNEVAEDDQPVFVSE